MCINLMDMQIIVLIFIAKFIKNIIMKLHYFFIWKSSFILKLLVLNALFVCVFGASQEAWAAPETTEPFGENGNHFTVTDKSNSSFIEVQFPFYDDKGNDRYFTNGRLEYSINGGNTWTTLLEFTGSNQDEDSWYWLKLQKKGTDKIETLPTKGGNTNYQEITSSYKSFNYQYTNWGGSKGPTFAKVRWYHNSVNNTPVIIRLYADLSQNSNGSSTRTWYLEGTSAQSPWTFVKGNPLNAPQINSFEILSDGKVRVSASVPNYNVVYDKGTFDWDYCGLFLESKTKGLNTNDSKKSAANVIYNHSNGGPHLFTTNSPLIRDLFNNGETYQVSSWRRDIYCTNPTAGGEYIIKYSNQSSLPPYPCPSNLTASAVNGKITLTWNMVQGTPSSIADNYQIKWRRGTGAWQTVANLTKTYVYNDLRPTVTFVYPETELGTNDYQFLVARNKFNYENNTYNTISTTVRIATNKITVTGIEAKIQANGSVKVSWNSDAGRINENFRYKLYRKVGAGSFQFLKDFIMNDSKEYIDNDVASCTPHIYEVRIHDGAVEYSPNTSSPIVKPSNNIGSIENLRISKGFYNDRVSISWEVSEGSGFNSFRIYRSPKITSGTSARIQIHDVAVSGLKQYAYDDTTAIAGLYYDYTVEGWTECDGKTQQGSSVTSTGFTQPYGIVSGKVSYGTSDVAVSNVTISAVGESDYANKSLEFTHPPVASDITSTYISIPYKTGSLSGTEFSFQAWLKEKATDGSRSLFSSHGRYWILKKPEYFEFHAFKNAYDFEILYLPYTQPDPNQYFHVTITYTRKENVAKAKLYINGEYVSEAGTNNYYGTFDIDGSSPHMLIGMDSGVYRYDGFMDEYRIWNKELTADEIFLNYDRYLSGREEGLALYYRFDETSGNEVFDMSGRNGIFNENHGTLVSSGGVEMRSTDVPTTGQLSIKAVTDKNGAYMINTIPFKGEGSMYTLVPGFGIHQFNPSDKPLFFNQQSSSYSNVNFTDISSFSVSGKVTYVNSNYPVDSVYISIDGIPANKDGQAIVTDVSGNFTVEVPIGSHFITVTKAGHTFVNGGRFPANELEKYNFQTSLSGLEFKDESTVRLMGRVAGGQSETDKPLGFGLSKANIGKATVTLRSVNDNYRLNMTDNDSIVGGNIIGGKESKTTFKKSIAGSEIEIETNPETGEFLAILPPVPYKVIGARTMDFVDTGSEGDPIDFAYDKMVINMNPNAKLTAEYTDPETMQKSSFAYHDSIKITRYNDPKIEVMDKEAVQGAFGDSIYVYRDAITGEKDTLWMYTVNNGVVNYALGVPVLSQAKTFYTWQVKAFEEYINRDEVDPVISTLPLEGKEVSISNALAAEWIEVDKNYENELDRRESSTTLFLDSVGCRDYRFRVSFPNMAGNHQLGAKFTLNQNGKDYIWETSAILLGQMPANGSNFVTKGPDHVDIVLRDPPGSNSSAYIEKGSSYKLLREHTDIETITENVDVTLHIGTSTSTSTGFGVALIDEIKNYADLQTETEFEEVITNNNSREETITFNQRISTSGDPNYVGSMADVYIGRSTNLIFGMMRQLALYPENQLPEGVTPSHTLGSFSLFPQEVLTSDEKFETMFQYTQKHIIGTQIPNIKELRNNLLVTITNWNDTINMIFVDTQGEPLDARYVTLLDRNHPDFGKESTYKWIINKNLPKDKISIDQVNEYNNWIVLWENVIASNEQHKVELKKANEGRIITGISDIWSGANIFENISYDAGTSIEKSLEVGYESYEIGGVNFTGGSSISAGTVAKIKKGLYWGLEAKIKIGGKRETGTTTTEGAGSSITFGYSLSEDESVLFAGQDALSVDVFGPTSEDLKKVVKGDSLPNLAGFTFVTRAGQTSCPHEPADSTLYYKENEKPVQLNYGTFQIENAQLYIDEKNNAGIENIPAGRTGTFTLQMQNLSEAKMDITYQLSVVGTTNPDGLILELDGEPLTASRQYRIKYGEEIIKTLKVRQSSLDVLEYDSIVIRLGSVCDIDTYSEAYLSARFIPSSSPVTLAAGSRLVNRTTMDEGGGKIMFTISEYDRNFKNFGCIRMQYRKTTEENWTTVREYVNDEALYPPNENRELITGHTINYEHTFGEITPSDGEYLFRALAVSKIGYDEITTSSEEILVVKDVRIPQLLGNASPGNGILNAGDEISITFNEEIQTGLITDDKFSITGILNADQRMEPTVGLAFTGTEKAFTEQPVYTNGSFTIEGWIKRPQHASGTLFAFGEGDHYLSLDFDAAGHAVVTIGSETFTSTGTITASEVWKYIGISYNRAKNTVSVYALEETNTLLLIDEEIFTQQAPTQGKLYVGNKASGGNTGFSGAVGLLHFYNVARSLIDASTSKYEVKSGNEPNLIGLWEMEEGEGLLARDKARSRDLTLHTSWYIYPSGRSLAFNGTNQYAKIQSGTFPFRSFEDFTWEFWFKAPSQGVATMLSCGLTDYIGFNANHQLILTRGGYTQILSTANWLDNEWHHFALSVKRNGTAKALVDGKVTASFSSNIFSGTTGGGYYCLGAKYTISEESEADVYSEYFNGNIDELRVWSSALTTEGILLEKNHKLRGTEAGLKAYYPFESYQKRDQLIEVYESLSDMVNPGLSVGNVSQTSIIAAPMQDCRPVKNVPFTVTASSYKVVLNITEEDYRIEGVTLNIKAKEILDMHNNPSNTYSWIAFVNRNPLKWDTDDIHMVMEQFETKGFTAAIMNKSGEHKDFTLENIPSWLTAVQTQGTLKPLEAKNIVFNISKGVNIGSYEESIVLTSANGVKEILTVRLKVTGQDPGWIVNPHDFKSAMNVTGQVKIEGVFQEDPDDLLAAFIDEQCVGVASPVYISSMNAYFTFMDIYGNSEHKDKDVKFKLWDASTGIIYTNVELGGAVSGTIQFNASDMFGNVNTPVIQNALNVIEQSITLGTGWTWFSVNVTNTNTTLLEQFKRNAGNTKIFLKGHTTNIECSGSLWSGSLTSITNTEMYAANTVGKQLLKMEGRPVNVSSTPITLFEGWNWIGYTPQSTLWVKGALAGINAQEGDQIKGQTGYATYMGANGWIGSLEYMQPGKGYMYYSANPQNQTFTYPNIQESSLRSGTAIVEERDKKWNVNPHHFANNMTMTSIVLINGLEVLSDNIEIAAFNGEDCRGSIFLQHESELPNPYIGFLMIYGVPGEEFSFRMYNHETGKEYVNNDHIIRFESNKRFGSLLSPYHLDFLEAQTSIRDFTDKPISIYPNPVTTMLTINRPVEIIEKLEIIDLSGRIIYQTHDWNEESLNISDMKPGYYVLKLIINNKISYHQFMKK